MALPLHRLDAVYTAALVPPAVDLAGNSSIVATVKALYRAFSDRYSWIGADSFRALTGNTLAEVGVGVSLLGGRLDFNLRVDQLIGRASGLQTQEEVTFAQDSALLAHNLMRQMFNASSIGVTTIRLSAWLNIEGGGNAVDALLNERSIPSRPFELSHIERAQSLLFTPRMVIASEQDGWRLAVTAERSVAPAADLFILRDYAFAANTKVSTLEQQFAFIDSTTLPILEWLGIGGTQH